MKKLIIISSLFLLGGCSYFDSNPPVGKTDGYVHTETFNNNESNNEEVDSQSEPQVEIIESESVKDEVQVEEEVQTAMAIFVPDPAKMIYITLEVEEELPYTEEELAYWNAVAIEYGLPIYDGVSDFDQFVASVEQAIILAEEAAAASAEPVYEEPVYEEPVYEEPIYEVPSSQEPPIETTPVEETPDETSSQESLVNSSTSTESQ